MRALQARYLLEQIPRATKGSMMANLQASKPPYLATTAATARAMEASLARSTWLPQTLKLEFKINFCNCSSKNVVTAILISNISIMTTRHLRCFNPKGRQLLHPNRCKLTSEQCCSTSRVRINNRLERRPNLLMLMSRRISK